MQRFFQLHLLTPYPPSNVNRDDLGHPKTAIMGGAPRLRISSQALKRAWRMSEVFRNAAVGHIGDRTQRLPQVVYDQLLEAGVSKANAKKWTEAIGNKFGKVEFDEDKAKVRHAQLVHISPKEMAAVRSLTETLISDKRGPDDNELELLVNDHKAVDIGMFGRMLANTPKFNSEAACQVAHAISVERVVAEDDWFAAVDDLNPKLEDAGSAHIGTLGFGAALFYLYVCIDRQQLLDNLQGDVRLCQAAIRGLIEAAATVPPSGKQNSFASRVHAVYGCGELGSSQPRSLATAFYQPIEASKRYSLIESAVKNLEDTRNNFNAVYGIDGEHVSFNAASGAGTLASVVDLAANGLEE